MRSSTLTALLVLCAVFQAVQVAAQTLVKPDDGTGIHVYYRTAWTEVNIHYSVNGGGWTDAPGVKMAPASGDDALFPKDAGWFRYDLAAPASTLEFVFNDNKGWWDNNNNNNLKIVAPGTYSIVSQIASPTSPPELCTNWNGWDACNGTQLDAPTANDSRKWQTPTRNASNWKPEYQDYRSLTGYAHVAYDVFRLSATVSVRTNLRVPFKEVACSYTYNGRTLPWAEYKVFSFLQSTELQIVVKCIHKTTKTTWTLALDPVNFVWQNQKIPTKAAGHEKGQRGAIVDMFGWPYKDIEEECMDFLGKAGYLGVKINPPQESLLSDTQLQDGQRNPWYYVYQPVSYRLYSRLGTRSELRSMIQTCRANGVRVYADAVVNHMVGGSDIAPDHRTSGDNGQCYKWGGKSSSKGSPYFSHQYHFQNNNQTGLRPALEFPAVPYGPSDFHCERLSGDSTDPLYLNGQWLVGLADLNTAKSHVQERIAQYFVDLLGIGFSGFRIDAYKHIHPRDIAAIFGLLNKFMGGSLPEDFLSWGEITLDPGQATLVACNENSGYNFYKGLDKQFLANGISKCDLEKLKIWSADYPANFPVCGSWILPPSRFVVQNDDHDQQSADSTTRPMGTKGSVLVLDKDVSKHRGFEVLLFNRTDADWKIKVVLSSYTHFADGTAGFPDGLSDCAGFDTSSGQTCKKSVPYEKAFRKGSCGYTVDGFQGGKYTRVHRDLAIVNAMRKWLGGLKAVSAKDLGILGDCVASNTTQK